MLIGSRLPCAMHACTLRPSEKCCNNDQAFLKVKRVRGQL